MLSLDLTLPTPAENLACDEALLDQREAEGGADILRFWEPRDYFIVTGYANRIDTEVHATACNESGIPIFRRCSGGGTVLQGPGCLNYSMILRVKDGGPLGSVPSANRFIMERNRTAIETLLASRDSRRTSDPKVEINGHTDLSIGGLKFSGNSQRRRRKYLLFHGTFLLEFDLALVEKLLPMPSRQPSYRQNRSHEKFLINLHLPAASVKTALCAAWRAANGSEPPPREAISRLARDKYVTREWNFKN